MKLLKKTGYEAQLGQDAFAQRLEAIASRHKVGTTLYDNDEDAPSDRD